MTVVTAAAILLEQSNQLMTIVNQVTVICNQINNIATQENSQADVNERIKAMCASVNVQNDAVRSQTILLQGALDQLSQLVN